MIDLTGQTIAQHEILERLGRGGMADVYKAFHPALAMYRAVKVIRPEFVDDENFRERFQREAQAVASLRHPGIVQVHDFGEHDGLYYMVMEFVEGSDLAKRLSRERPLSGKESRRIVAEVAAALTEAHRKGVIHRDIKPSNIMINHEGHAILTDFGIAKMLRAESRITGTGIGIGTPAYMAPEQAKGYTDIGPEADIYALGIVLYELLTGEVPFDADTPLAVIHKVINDPLPRPSERNPRIPPELESVILKASAKNPDDRYASALELAQALRTEATPIPSPETATVQLKPSEQSTAVTSSAADSPPSWTARLAVGTVSVLVLVMGGFLWQSSLAPPPERVAEELAASEVDKGSRQSPDMEEGEPRSEAEPRVAIEPSDEASHGQAESDLRNAPLEKTIADEIGKIGEIDRHQFAGGRGDRVTILLQHGLGRGYLNLFAPDGSRLANRDFFGNEDVMIRNQRLEADGAFAVSVAAHGTQTGPYKLSLLRPAYDFAAIVVNEPLKGRISPPGKAFAYRFEAESDDRITVLLQHGLTRGYLNLFAPDGTRVANRDFFGTSDVMIRNQALPADGVYTVSVLAHGGLTGAYTLRVLRPAWEVHAISVDTPFKGRIDPPGKSYAHRFEANDGDEVTVLLEHRLGHGWLTLYAPDGSKVGAKEFYGNSDVMIRNQHLDRDGTYTATLWAQGGSTGPYTLSVISYD